MNSVCVRFWLQLLIKSCLEIRMFIFLWKNVTNLQSLFEFHSNFQLQESAEGSLGRKQHCMSCRVFLLLMRFSANWGPKQADSKRSVWPQGGWGSLVMLRFPLKIWLSSIQNRAIQHERSKTQDASDRSHFDLPSCHPSHSIFYSLDCTISNTPLIKPFIQPTHAVSAIKHLTHRCDASNTLLLNVIGFSQKLLWLF